MNTADIRKLSRSERLQIMDTLWDSFLNDDIDMDSPEWHGGVLDERRKTIESGKAEFISLDKLKKYRNP